MLARRATVRRPLTTLLRRALSSTTLASPHQLAKPLPTSSLPEYLIEAAAAFGDKPALIDGQTGATLRYSELADKISAVASGLAARGLAKGDVIGICSPNTIDYPILVLGATWLGATVTTLNPAYTPFEMARQLTDSNAKSLFVAAGQLDAAHAAIAEGAALTRMYALDMDEEAAAAASGSTVPVEAFSTLLADGLQTAPPPIGFDPSTTVAAIPYSSGTSGMPKGVELTHAAMVANIAQCTSAHMRLTPTDTLVGVLPFYHIYGLSVVINVALCSGATVVSLPRFDPELFLSVLSKHDVTIAHLAPPLVGFLAKHPSVDSVLPLPHLREIVCGAAPMGEEVETAVEERLGLRVRQAYGMSEAMVTHMMPPDVSPVRGAVGTLLPGMEAKLVDVETGRAVSEQGTTGEICLRGPNLMKGYLNRPEANSESIDAEGFYRTGDVGYVDEAGNYFIVDRVKELIKVKGFQVAPAELEATLLGNDAIADAAVIGVACAKQGEAPKAFVVRQPGPSGSDLTAEAVAAFLKGKVAEYKLIAPERVVFVDAVPKSPAGKILRKELRAAEAA